MATAHSCQFTQPDGSTSARQRVGLLDGGGSVRVTTNGKDLTIIVEAMPSAHCGGAGRQSERHFQLTGAFASIPSLNVFHSNFARDGQGCLIPI